jgi:chromosome partitioning protein
VVNQKGGVGKTTLAVHLAAWYLLRGQRVAFIDADGQASSTRWLSAAGWTVTIVTETRADPILEAAASLRADHDVVVADGPASLAESTRALLLAADYALVPCGVSVLELESTAETLRMLVNARRVRGGERPAAHLVLTRVRGERFLLTRDARETVAQMGTPVCRHVLRLREAVADAAGQRTAVWTMGKRAGVATVEMLELLKEIDAHARTTIDDGNAQHGRTVVCPRTIDPGTRTSDDGANPRTIGTEA